MAAEAILGAVLAIITGGALALKWQLGVRRSVVVTAILAIGPAVAVALVAPAGRGLAVAAVWAMTMLLAAGVVAHRFYRDPDRTPPAGDGGVVVSPADGTVIYVRRSIGGRLPRSTKLGRDYTLDELTRTPLHRGDAVVIGIALSFLDVHVNRAPVAGRILEQCHHPGRFASLRRPEAVLENERATIVLESDSREVAVVLIASRLVRRIVTFLEQGAHVDLGQRIGVIRFGSQVDLVLPDDGELAIAVAAGDRVVAGQSIVARAPARSAGPATPATAYVRD
jgi:phosphatidylserine decarboxylase